MNCQDNLVAILVTGEDFSLDVFLTQDGTNQPYDLTGVTEIVAILPNADGTTFLEKKLTTAGIVLVSAPGGHFQIVGTGAESKLLLPNEATAIDVRITISSKTRFVRLDNAVNVIAPAYPAAP